MFENLLTGPICIVYTKEDRNFHFKEIDRNGFHPILEIKEGELFEEIKLSIPRGKKLQSIILCIGYKNLYKE
jgi:hypothetical protein